MGVPTATVNEAKGVRSQRFGVSCHNGFATFRLWAPRQAAVSLLLGAGPAQPMRCDSNGWFSLTLPAAPGARYSFELADGQRVPDPVSRYQPEDVHGPSEIVADDFVWTDADWRGVPWPAVVIYELHVGTFTPEGTFRAAAERLAYLKSLGVTAIELMPIADFPGRWNWGYDGVLPFAPDSRYGRPEDLKALVDRAHALGLAVLLDVVYNHFGPDGNYLPALAPALTDEYHTPWGHAIDYGPAEGGSMRDLVLDNVRYWIAEFHFDGLRIDAAHEIRDADDGHILSAIAAVARAAGEGRHIHLILESANHEAARITCSEGFSAQWNDDLHHALHAAITGETSQDEGVYAERPDILAQAIAEGFWEGEEPAAKVEVVIDRPPPSAYVGFLQNHDQIGNRARGDRIHPLACLASYRAAAATYLLAPQIPMLFQGEEWAASTPFPFFSDLAEHFAEPVRSGRLAAFPTELTDLPDPFDPSTFASAKLDWKERDGCGHARLLDWYRSILRTRQREIVPLIGTIERPGRWRVEEGVVRVEWEAGERELSLTLNLTRQPAELQTPLSGRPIWHEGRISDGRCSPWSLVWAVKRRR
jgi:maltooligosyltrehalose trehalohydrolase